MFLPTPVTQVNKSFTISSVSTNRNIYSVANQLNNQLHIFYDEKYNQKIKIILKQNLNKRNIFFPLAIAFISHHSSHALWTHLTLYICGSNFHSNYPRYQEQFRAKLHPFFFPKFHPKLTKGSLGLANFFSLMGLQTIGITCRPLLKPMYGQNFR